MYVSIYPSTFFRPSYTRQHKNVFTHPYADNYIVLTIQIVCNKYSRSCEHPFIMHGIIFGLFSNKLRLLPIHVFLLTHAPVSMIIFKYKLVRMVQWYRKECRTYLSHLNMPMPNTKTVGYPFTPYSNLEFLSTKKNRFDELMSVNYWTSTFTFHFHTKELLKFKN